MTWYAIYNKSTGRLVSLGTVITDPLPAHLEAVTLADKPADSEMWDEATKAYVPRPAKVLMDRLQDLVTHGDYADDFKAVWDTLSAGNKTKIRNGLIRLLGRHRFRNQSESIEIN